jgi:hypothetical protein
MDELKQRLHAVQVNILLDIKSTKQLSSEHFVFAGRFNLHAHCRFFFFNYSSRLDSFHGMTSYTFCRNESKL